MMRTQEKQTWSSVHSEDYERNENVADGVGDDKDEDENDDGDAGDGECGEQGLDDCAWEERGGRASFSSSPALTGHRHHNQQQQHRHLCL